MITIFRDRCSPFGSLGYIDLRVNPEGFDRIYTLERPWVPALPRSSALLEPAPCGRKGVSCVPPGIYDLVPHSSEAHPDTFALVNLDLWVYHLENQVPVWRKEYARTAVLIHPANWVEELRGCIAPGMTRTEGPGMRVSDSRRAFDMLRMCLRGEKRIEIIEL